MGVYDKLGFMPPPQWNVDLVLDVNSSMNSLVKYGKDKSPIELFTGQVPDRLRGLRGHPWGSIVLTKPPKTNAAASMDNPKADYSVVVRRYWDRSGILKVYQVLTGKYAYRLQAKKVLHPPEWVLSKLRAIDPKAEIGYEEETYTDAELHNQKLYFDEDNVELNENELRMVENYDGGDNINAAAAREIAERVLEPMDFEPAYDEPPQADEVADEIVNELEAENLANMGQAHRDLVEERQEAPNVVEQQVLNMPRYPVRERAPKRFIDHFVYAVTYEKAYKIRPEQALKALDAEIDNWENNAGFHGVWRENLTLDQQKLVLDNMMNFIEKYSPNNEHIKDKVRILYRGDKQWSTMIGETYGPVCRVESLFLILQIAVVHEMKLFRIDVVAAFLKTPMPDAVKHRWMYLQKNVSQRLVERNPEKWSKFLDSKGRILVEMDKLGYGYQEACHYFGELMIEVMIGAKMERHPSDICTWTYRRDGRVIHCGTIVDDICGVADSEETIDWFHQEMVKGFKDVVLERGDSIAWVGMQIDFCREGKGHIDLSQKKYLADVCKRFNVTKTAPTPSLMDLHESDPESPLYKNQTEYMSAVQSAAFAAHRTVPQIMVAVNYCATRFGKATDQDWKKIMRVIAYLNGIKDTQRVRLEAANLQKVIVTADASYCTTEGCKSITGGCVGFPGNQGRTSYSIWVSKKQSIVARSTSESELIAATHMVEYGLWVTYMLRQLGYGEAIIELEQDNTASINFITRGRGTFQRTKHIKVRMFWIKMLIDTGELVVKYVPTAEMTADILTKPLTGVLFLGMVLLLIGWNGI
jgi:Reverse transcriptase (RNA-dependent DNA polymerase)